MIGTSGGTITETSGAEVVFPAGAVDSDTTFRIAMDSTGAPATHAELQTSGNVYTITPHGGEFDEPVEVRIPAPNITLQPNQLLKIATAQPGGEWVVLDDTELANGKLTAKVNHFSYFRPVVISFPAELTPTGPVPISYTTTLTCNGGSCGDLLTPVNTVFTVSSNHGLIPEGCGAVFIARTRPGRDMSITTSDVMTPIAFPFHSGSRSEYLLRPTGDSYTWGITMYCRWGYVEFGQGTMKHAIWRNMPLYPAVSVVDVPAQVDVVEGQSANIEVLLGGGALGWTYDNTRSYDVVPTPTNRAIVDWQISRNGGGSWTNIAQSYQNEANNMPFGVEPAWEPWSVNHGFVATAADQGALIRVRACYTPTVGVHTGGPCATGTSTRINVLQLSQFPSIVDSPRPQLILTGQTANFMATASGLPAPALQWQTRPANSTGDWINVSTGSGGTTNNYTTAPLERSDNGMQFRVVATNSVGSAASQPVAVSVNDEVVAPGIATHPGSLSVTAGNDAVFAVVAYGTEALSYQWRFNGVNLPGNNSPVLRLYGVTDANAGIYSVVVSNAAGSVASNNETLTVTAGTAAVVTPSIVTQPAPVTVNAGNTATFAVGVNGTGPFTFQWRRDGNTLAGATSAALTLNNVALLNAGEYSVVVSNSAGAIVSSNALLTVAEASGAIAPTITSQPSTLIVPSGGSGFLAVGATGSGPLSYQWRFNGTNIPGATLPVLNLTNVSNTNVGAYSVNVTNSVSSTVSQSAQIILLGAPTINTEPAATTAAEGQSAMFSVVAEGSGLRYQWLRNGSAISGATDASYITPTLVSANSGAVYSVMVYNGAGLVISQGAVLTVEVIVAPSVTEQPTNVTIQPGAAAAICATFGGTTPLDVWLQRWVGGAWQNTGSAPLPTTNVNTCFYSPNLLLGDSGAQFRLFASNASGQVVTNTVTVTVSAPPPPSGVTLVSVNFAGNPPDFASSKPSISANGRFVAFTSQGTDLVPGGTTNGTHSGHAYLRDRETGTTTLINQTTSGGVSTHGVVDLRMSSNGQFAVFTSLAADLVAGDTNGSMDVFRRNLVTGVTERVNLLENGSQVEGESNGTYDARLAISGNGRTIAYMSRRNMYNSEPNGNIFLYYRDMQDTASVYISGEADSPPIGYVAMSDDGWCIAYTPGVEPGGLQTINVYDIESNGDDIEIFSFVQSPFPAGLRPGISISANCRYVAFTLNSPALTGGAFNQVLLTDLQSPQSATIVSTTPAFAAGDGDSEYPAFSGDGRYLTFISAAPNLTNGLGLNSRRYLVMRDLVGNATSVVSRRSNGAEAPLGATFGHIHAISRDGSTIAFMADHAEVMGGATGNQVFVSPR